MNVFYMTCDTLINYLNLNFELELVYFVMREMCILLELNVTFASPQQRVTVTRHLKRDSYNFVTEMTRDADDIFSLKVLQF